jgi:hypothetical protein
MVVGVFPHVGVAELIPLHLFHIEAPYYRHVDWLGILVLSWKLLFLSGTESSRCVESQRWINEQRVEGDIGHVQNCQEVSLAGGCGRR